MKALQDLIDKLKGFERELFEAIELTLRENEHIITEMNSEDQLYEQGIDRFGTSIASYAPYSPITIEIKKAKGQPTGRVTLRDEGDFHLSFYIDFSKDGFEIKAGNWKTDSLVKGYGEGILGLTDENFKDLADNYIAPEIINVFKKL
jgi:hypothetical protein